MMVPGPGHSDAEQELHASLLDLEGEGSESDVELSALDSSFATTSTKAVSVFVLHDVIFSVSIFVAFCSLQKFL